MDFVGGGGQSRPESFSSAFKYVMREAPMLLNTPNLTANALSLE